LEADLWISRPFDSAGQPEPSALVLNEPSCYHVRALDPRLPLCRHLEIGFLSHSR
jgi:hypothetical protein